MPKRAVKRRSGIPHEKNFFGLLELNCCEGFYARTIKFLNARLSRNLLSRDSRGFHPWDLFQVSDYSVVTFIIICVLRHEIPQKKLETQYYWLKSSGSFLLIKSHTRQTSSSHKFPPRNQRKNQIDSDDISVNLLLSSALPKLKCPREITRQRCSKFAANEFLANWRKLKMWIW